MPDGLVVAATSIEPPEGGDCWAFHVINTSLRPLDAVILRAVDYGRGDMGSTKTSGQVFAAITPWTSREIWRDGRLAGERRVSLLILVRTAGRERELVAEFPRLQRSQAFVPVPVLGTPGILGQLV